MRPSISKVFPFVRPSVRPYGSMSVSNSEKNDDLNVFRSITGCCLFDASLHLQLWPLFSLVRSLSDDLLNLVTSNFNQNTTIFSSARSSIPGSSPSSIPGCPSGLCGSPSGLRGAANIRPTRCLTHMCSCAHSDPLIDSLLLTNK